ncbi:SgcJ/EcaC family oxidoreductase [Micromonospora cathayae]|uniref:SgcJ/EcaC family oxidoreductase n=1 Tax=Micromonospora cathayae TaxID=3028804 RepID=A0ABY7ZKR0_9ACTN|nr:SgcJ/EcaC family oxidoreductase [Micromonospora sp. HUAS 3]WDZ83505.1 SgcJ/EcaC family oxidoreductase [Micromonospora sp. HUAS 3]
MTTSTHPGLSPAEQAAVAAVPARMIEAWGKHDADAFADLFVEDGTMMLPGLYVKGRDAIRAFMADAYASRYRGTTVTGKPIEIKPLGPGAVAVLTEGGVLPPGQTEVPVRAAIRASWILVKSDDRWRLAVYQNCPRFLG